MRFIKHKHVRWIVSTKATYCSSSLWRPACDDGVGPHECNGFGRLVTNASISTGDYSHLSRKVQSGARAWPANNLLTCKWREARGDSVGEQFLRVLPVTGSLSRTQPPLSQNISPLPPFHDGLTAVSKAPEMPWRVPTQTKSIKGKARRFWQNFSTSMSDAGKKNLQNLSRTLILMFTTWRGRVSPLRSVVKLILPVWWILWPNNSNFFDSVEVIVCLLHLHWKIILLFLTKMCQLWRFLKL